ncbi:hypothetical protein LCGC14_1485150 [marine sediment metagenome]|uniref:Uncharacterized protein n=1 Tax=marine sediment metagenome TaxID=412755 RepID=A0A0F9LNX1_9ZZZZ
MKKIGIVGSRGRNDSNTLWALRDGFFRIYQDGDWIVSGGAKKGGDWVAYDLSNCFGIPILIFNARWDYEWDAVIKRLIYRTAYNKAAGFIRNKPIAHHSDVLIATPKPETVEFFRNLQGSVMIKDLNKLKGGTENTIGHWIRHKSTYSEGDRHYEWNTNNLILL